MFLDYLLSRENRGRKTWFSLISGSHFSYRQGSVQFSHSVMSDSLRPHRLQHARLSCPSLIPRACSNSCPSSWWCHPTISSCHAFSSCLQSFPASASFPMSQFFTSCDQSTGAISLSNEYSGLISFRMDWLDLLAVQGTLKSLLQHHTSKASILRHPSFFTVQLSHPYMTTGKTIALTSWTFVGKVMSLLCIFLIFLQTKISTFTKNTIITKSINWDDFSSSCDKK